MTPEDKKILNEDAFDLFVGISELCKEYFVGYGFEHKDKAIVAALGNAVGSYFNAYTHIEDREDALEVFSVILDAHLQN